MPEEIDPEVLANIITAEEIKSLLTDLKTELQTLNTQLAKLTFTGSNSVLSIHETTPT